MWWIKAAIQEHILHNWSMVKLGTTAAQKKLFFNLRRLKAQLGETGSGDLPPEAVASIARDLAVESGEVIEMNRRLAGGDASLNAAASARMANTSGATCWSTSSQDQESRVAEASEFAWRRDLLAGAMGVLNAARAPHPDRARLKDEPATSRSWPRSTACRASASGRSRSAPSSACSRRCWRQPNDRGEVPALAA